MKKSEDKSQQTPTQRAKVNKAAVAKLKKLLAGTPTEVLGHIDSLALCCHGGTVAIVKVDLASNPAPRTGKKTKKAK
jgi:hypothetical protein